jgi:hypothetical protein
MRKFFVFFVSLLVFIAILGLVLYIVRKDKTEKVLIYTHSEVPGFSLTMKNEKDLQKFLADVGFINNEVWRLDNSNQEEETFYKSKIDTLEIIYSDKPQLEWQVVDIENIKENEDFPVMSSVGKIFQDTKLSIVIQIDLSRLDSTNEADLVINDLFLKVLSDILPQKIEIGEGYFLKLTADNL